MAWFGGWRREKNGTRYGETIFSRKNNNPVRLVVDQMVNAGRRSERDGGHAPIGAGAGEALRCEVSYTERKMGKCCSNGCSSISAALRHKLCNFAGDICARYINK